MSDFTMVVEKGLHSMTKDISIDYVNHGYGSGFKVTSEAPVGGGGNCGGSCSC